MKNVGKQQRSWIRWIRVGAVVLIVLTATSCSRQAAEPTGNTPREREGAATTDATGGTPTPASTEGPFFKENAPRRTSLIEPGVEGTMLVVTGRVLTRSGRPVAQARLDFWQTDSHGAYDNVGYKLRGHQFTDEEGRYRLETIVPGEYQPRTRHIHVKVRPPEGPELTTQLYMPDEPANQADPIFRPELVMDVSDTEGGKHAEFDFVLDVE